MDIPFAQIDAFASAPFTGNPAAVMPLEHWLDDATLQAIAEENKLSETAFIVPIAGDADWELRWFTPTSEVALCGHATLASGHYLLADDASLERVRFRTRQAGVLEVARHEGGYAMALPAWGPSPKPLPEIVAALGLRDATATLWQEKGYALIVVPEAAAVTTIAPDFARLATEGKIVTIVTAPGSDTDIVSRVFTPAFGMNEDPVTGSAHAVMTSYWVARLGRDHLTAHQASARGGRMTCRLIGERVVLEGQCVTVIEGVFRL